MSTPKLICFDFDQTLVKGHFHSTLADLGVMPNSEAPGVQMLQGDGHFKNILTQENVGHTRGASDEIIQRLLSSELGLKNPNELLQLLIKAIDDGHHIAVTSFTLYPEVVKPTLQKLGLPESYLSKIVICGGFPSHNLPDRSPNGKQEHIQAAREHFSRLGVQFNNSDIALIDDSRHNIQKAQLDGYQGVLVPKSPHAGPEYLESLNEFLNPINDQRKFILKAGLQLSLRNLKDLSKSLLQKNARNTHLFSLSCILFAISFMVFPVVSIILGLSAKFIGSLLFATSIYAEYRNYKAQQDVQSSNISSPQTQKEKLAFEAGLDGQLSWGNYITTLFNLNSYAHWSAYNAGRTAILKSDLDSIEQAVPHRVSKP